MSGFSGAQLTINKASTHGRQLTESEIARSCCVLHSACCRARTALVARPGEAAKYCIGRQTRCCSGAIIFRTIQINVGFDRRGHENCIKLALNEHVRSASFAALSVKVLDIEAMTASRPETFVHEASNHFFCQCVSGFERATPMCETAACLRKRAHRFENGEAHRALAQMVLSALDAADIAS